LVPQYQDIKADLPDITMFENIGKSNGSTSGVCSVRRMPCSKGYGGDFFLDTLPFNG
jgi:hypothetical protein